MIDTQNLQFVQAIPPQSPASAGDAQQFVVDTAGYEYLTYVSSIGTAVAGFDEYCALESDTVNGVFGTVPNSAFGASPNTTAAPLPTATSDFTNGAIFIPLFGRKRYHKFRAKVGTGGAVGISVLAILSRGEQAPSTATLRGLVQGQVIL